MSETKPTNQPAEAKTLTRAAAAKLVRRPTTEMVDGKDAEGKAIKVPRIKKVAVDAAEVLSVKDYDTHVVVVTTDGQKFSSADE